MSIESAAVIANYRPRSLSAEAGEFARSGVTVCLPLSRPRAKSLLFAMGRLGEFCSSVGLELVSQTCLHPSVIERFIATGCPKSSDATRRTLRTNLRFVARSVLPEHAPAPAPLGRERSKFHVHAHAIDRTYTLRVFSEV